MVKIFRGMVVKPSGFCTLRIDSLFFSYENTVYNHEIDSIFNPKIVDKIKLERTYITKKQGSMFFKLFVPVFPWLQYLPIYQPGKDHEY